ncbi:sensor histidine kinase [Paenibacillus sp. 2TAB19]|uniref:sensor histidine kinase n=1 Tax=Paenibacillus sp. 2TAB19 TaxID=3233003 RepID=UPI003F997914
MKFLYILMFLSMWSLGIFFLFRRTTSNFWIAQTFLVGGMASYTFSMHLTIMPYFVDAAWLPELLSRLLYLSTVVAMNLYFYVLPYVFCMSGLLLNEKISLAWKRGWTILLFVGMAVLFGDHLINEPWNTFELHLFRLWDGLFVAFGCVFYMLAYVRERKGARGNSQRRTLVLPVVMLWAYVSDYMGMDYLQLGWWTFELRSNGVWHANVVIIFALFAAMLFFSIRYGIFGLKLRIERERLDYSIRTLTMGVTILNHSIKNEIQKVDYLAEKSVQLLVSGKQEHAVQTISQIHGLTSHLLHMVNRIKEKAEDIELDVSTLEIRELIEAVTASSRPLTESRAVRLTTSYETYGKLIGDEVHLKETLSNLIRNALDSISGEGGEIRLHTSYARRELRIDVIDNGAGITPEDLSRIFEPFYTTKKNALNYGLGLSYCRGVMAKHGGKLTVAASELGKGTTFRLHFPRHKFKPSERIQVAELNELKESNHEQTA